MQLLQAIGELDPRDDTHWTNEGTPRLQPLSEMMGAPVTRAAVTSEAPGYTREKAHERLAAALAARAAQTDDQWQGEQEREQEREPGAQPSPTISAPAPAAPTTAPQSALALPIHVVLESYPLIMQAQQELEDQIVETGKEIDRARARLADLSAKSDLLERHKQRQLSLNPELNGGKGDLREYLNSQHAQREERAARLRRLSEAGVTVADVRSAIRGPSAIDDALRPRNSPLGSRRPVARGASI